MVFVIKCAADFVLNEAVLKDASEKTPRSRPYTAKTGFNLSPDIRGCNLRKPKIG